MMKTVQIEIPTQFYEALVAIATKDMRFIGSEVCYLIRERQKELGIKTDFSQQDDIFPRASPPREDVVATNAKKVIETTKNSTTALENRLAEVKKRIAKKHRHSNKGYRWTPEQKKNLSEIQKAVWRKKKLQQQHPDFNNPHNLRKGKEQ